MTDEIPEGYRRGLENSIRGVVSRETRVPHPDYEKIQNGAHDFRRRVVDAMKNKYGARGYIEAYCVRHGSELGAIQSAIETKNPLTKMAVYHAIARNLGLGGDEGAKR